MCEFCNLLRASKELATVMPHEYKYTVILIEDEYVDGEPKGTESSKRYTLNYCPLCGRNYNESIEPRKLIWPSDIQD